MQVGDRGNIAGHKTPKAAQNYCPCTGAEQVGEVGSRIGLITNLSTAHSNLRRLTLSNLNLETLLLSRANSEIH